MRSGHADLGIRFLLAQTRGVFASTFIRAAIFSGSSSDFKKEAASFMGQRLHNVISKSKRQITQCNAFLHMLTGMSEEWENLKEQAQRVKWARVNWQTKNGAGTTAKDAAESLGMPESTYLQYERMPGTSRSAELSEQYAHRFARKFKVDWVWLLTGRGSPFLTDEQERERISLRIASAPSDKREMIDKMLDVILGDDQSGAADVKKTA